MATYPLSSLFDAESAASEKKIIQGREYETSLRQQSQQKQTKPRAFRWPTVRPDANILMISDDEDEDEDEDDCWATIKFGYGMYQNIYFFTFCFS